MEWSGSYRLIWTLVAVVVVVAEGVSRVQDLNGLIFLNSVALRWTSLGKLIIVFFLIFLNTVDMGAKEIDEEATVVL